VERLAADARVARLILVDDGSGIGSASMLLDGLFAGSQPIDVHDLSIPSFSPPSSRKNDARTKRPRATGTLP
jgi:hypothetical protein